MVIVFLQVEGNIFVVYNMGQLDLPVGEPYHKVNDGKYHVIRFTRSGANATLQIDKWDRATKVPIRGKVLLLLLICLSLHSDTQKREYDQEMPQSHFTDEPIALRGRHIRTQKNKDKHMKIRNVIKVKELVLSFLVGSWVDPEGGQEVWTPLKNHKNIGFLKILVRIP